MKMTDFDRVASPEHVLIHFKKKKEVQLNFGGSNTFGIMKINSRQG